VIDMSDYGKIAYKALQILTHGENRFIIVTASQVVKEIASAYNHAPQWLIDSPLVTSHRSMAKQVQLELTIDQ
jgi:hypothetical protein